MNLKRLKLSHFRNYENAEFRFEPNMIHVLYGRNAQGKTNILEAIYFLSHLRSFRTSKTQALIQHGHQASILEADLENKSRLSDLKVVLNQNKKSLFKYGNPVATYSSFVGIVNAILFCPDDLSLFSDSPKERRQFMDIELVKISKKYTSTLSHYQKILKERNQALKAWPLNPVLISTYASMMIEDQLILIEQRNSFLKLLETEANKILPHLSKDQETLKIRYKTFVDPDRDLKSQLEKAYEASRERDMKFQTTSAGVHKDDIEFQLNERILTQNASQGQKRSVMLALKLALAEIIYQKTGEYPILLLDDVFSELDSIRRQKLIAILPEGMQIFISSTDTVSPSWFKRPVQFYTVDHGVMKEGLFDV